MKKVQQKFSPIIHLPQYSRVLLDTLQTPLLIYFALAGNLILFGGIALFYHFEKGYNPMVQTFFDALWWGMATVTTVGYGDIVAVTPHGKVVGIGLMLAGVTFFIGYTAILVSVVTSQTSEDIQVTQQVSYTEYENVMKALSELEKKVEQLQEFLYEEKTDQVMRKES